MSADVVQYPHPPATGITLVSSARCLSERLAEVRFNQGRLIDRMGDVGFDFRRVTLGAVAGMSWAAASSKSDS